MGLPNAIQRWKSKPLLGKAPQHVFTDALDPSATKTGRDGTDESAVPCTKGTGYGIVPHRNARP